MRYLVFISFLFIGCISFSQEYDIDDEEEEVFIEHVPEKIKKYYQYPKSIMELGFGAGFNHGILGPKVLFGYKGNGLFLSYSTIDKSNASSIGIQLAYEYFYGTFAFGPFAAINDEIQRDWGGCLGGRINLVKKQLLLNISLGVAKDRWKDVYFSPDYYLIGNMGISYSLVLDK